ncbi:hypothetical protein TSUD_251060 [Trifolium subterraneum]|uniref:MaoC-like domain-containing protein n=1 Tax=Trifolium subterraneum TaxID=3900 RepID=A0A2Z6LWG1_TRISU|nr:hypothetical protein TSUD_251060 [Trifolium subterraneum]
MLFRSLHSSKLQYPSRRCFSSATPHVLKPGDVLKKTRVFTEEDVLEYSKVSHDSNPLHTDSAAARNVGFEGPLPAAVYASQTLILSYQSILEIRLLVKYNAKFKTRCFKNGEILVIEGEALALLATLDYRAMEV